MSPLVDRIVRTLANDADSEVWKALLDASDLFEKACGRKPCGWSEEVLKTNIIDAEIEQLKQAVVAAVQRRGFGSWALAKCYDPALMPVLVDAVRRHIEGDPIELYHAMMALEDLGEEIFAGMNPRGTDYKAANRKLARAYLRRRRLGYDSVLVPRLTDAVRRHIDGDPVELFRAMTALEDLGEDIFAGANPRCTDAQEENRKLARAYLQRRQLGG